MDGNSAILKHVMEQLHELSLHNKCYYWHFLGTPDKKSSLYEKSESNPQNVPQLHAMGGFLSISGYFLKNFKVSLNVNQQEHGSLWLVK